MTKKIIIILLFFKFFFIVSKTHSERNQNFRFLLKDYLSHSVAAGIVPGVSFSIYRFSSKIFSFQEGLTNQSTIGIASVTKPFTAFAIMKLVEFGKIGLDKPVDSYLKGVQPKNHKYNSSKITVRHLLQHTSCIPYQGKGKVYSIKDEEIFIPYQVCESGTKYIYSNTNYNILKVVIEKVSSNTYSDFLKSVLFLPLSMDNTDATFCNGAGGIRSNAEDLAKFANMLANSGIYKGRRIISEKLLAQMFQVPKNVVGGQNYGLGWHVHKRKKSLQYFYHTGIWNNSLCEIRIFPKYKTYYVQISNPKNYKSGKIRSYRNRVTHLATQFVHNLNKKQVVANQKKVYKSLTKLEF